MKLSMQIYGFFSPVLVLLLCSCTTEGAYNTAQAWQRNQCEQMVDQTIRQQCLSKLNMSFDAYKQQTQSAPDKGDVAR